jgi:hypothetical protein
MSNENPDNNDDLTVADTKRDSAAPSLREAPPIHKGVPTGTHNEIVVTFTLDPERYERLKSCRVKKRLSDQDVMIAALDSYLSENKL